ncbi:MAG: hypothetical protein U0872_10025 [Planctomycetaceae bacterium]
MTTELLDQAPLGALFLAADASSRFRHGGRVPLWPMAASQARPPKNASLPWLAVGSILGLLLLVLVYVQSGGNSI